MRFRQRVLRLNGRTAALSLAAFTVLTSFACSLDKLTGTTDPTTLPTFTVGGDSTVALGATMPMSISSSAGGTLNTSSAAVVWSTDNAAVATIDAATGVVTAVGVGTANVSAKVIAPEIGEITATTKAIRVKYAGIRITAVDSLIAIGMTKVFVVRGTNSSGALQAAIPFGASTQAVSRDLAIFEVNSAGSLVAKANGTARLFVQFDGLKDSVNVKVRQVARAISFPAAVANELPIQSLNKDRTLAVIARDSLGVAIASPTVAWSSSAPATVSVVTGTGVARGLLLGTARIRATVDGKIDSITARVTQVPATLTKIAGDGLSATVGTATATAPVVAVLDSGSTVIPGAAVTFTVASGGGSVTGGTQTSAAVTGQAAATAWTLGTNAGANTLTAASEGASTTFTATGTPGAAAKLIFSTQPSNSSATASAIQTFRVAVADANDNVVTTATNSITISLGSGPGTVGGTVTAAAVNGVATFSAVTLSALGTYTLSAAATGLTGATSNSFAIFGAAAKLGFTTQPAAGTAGVTLASFRVAVQDASGNTVTSATNTITLTLAPTGFTTGSTVSAAAVAGVATFSNVAITAAGTYTIGAAATGLTSATSSSFAIAAVGPPAKLTFTVHPANGVAGAALADIKVAVQDANGVTNTSSTLAITLGIETNVGSASLSGGSTTVSAVAGIATFSGVIMNRSGTGYRLNATSGALTKGVSNTFNVTAGAAFKLGFAASIPNSVVATAISPAVQVQVQDANGNVVTTATNAITITASGGTGTLSGGTATAAAAGVATFSALALSATGTYNLAATAAGLQNGASSSFSVVTATAPIKLAFITQPSNTAASTAVAPSIQVAIQDASGSTVSATTAVTLTIAGGPAGATMSGGTARAAVAGVATFDNVQFPLAGSGYSLSATATSLTTATSTSFTVSPGAPSRLAFLTQPQSSTAGVPFASDLQVQILDVANNLVTTATNTVTITYSANPGGGGTTSLKGTLSVPAVNGIATFPGIRVTRAASGYTLFATSTNLSSTVSSSFDISAAPATGLAFTRQPSFVVAGAVQNPTIQVSIADSLGNTVTTGSGSVTLAIGSGPVGGTMSGTATQATTAGVATFADVTFPKTGNYTLSATAADLATATSSSFFVTNGTATKLAFITQPTNTFANAPMNPGTNSVQVQVQDALGNGVTSNATITMALGTNTTGATLAGTLVNDASFGTMTVPADVKIDKAGTYTLTATATGLTAATSTSFTVAAHSTATKLGFLQAPTNNVTEALFRPVVRVAVQDQYGNTVTTGTSSTASILIGCNGTCAQGPNQLAAIAGVATFPDYTVSTAGSFTFFAGATGLSGASTSVAITITQATVATSAASVYDAVISNGNAFYIERGASGSVKQVSLSTGTTTVLASGLSYPGALVVDNANVYWLEDNNNATGSGGLVKRATIGVSLGSVVTMSTALSNVPSILQTDGTSLYFIANNAGNTTREIKKLAMNAAAGTTPTTLLTQACGTTASCQPTFTLNGGTIFYYDPATTTLKSATTSGAPVATLTTATSQPQSMVVIGPRLYWANPVNLLHVATSAASASPSTQGTLFSGFTRLGTDGTSLYTLDQLATRLRKYSVTDFSFETLTASTGGAATNALAFDGTFVFFADNSAPPKLRRLVK